jgi:hypothetical protein
VLVALANVDQLHALVVEQLGNFARGVVRIHGPAD